MTDLWLDSVFDENKTVEESNAVALLQEQARLLKSKTKGVVRATFSKLTGTTILDSPGASELIKGIKRFVTQPEKDAELQEKKDIGDLYKPQSYKFEIYNDTYRFRVFELVDKKLFPIYIICDPDIAIGMHREETIEIDSNKELEDVVRQIINSKKVKSIISRMMTRPAQTAP